MYHIAIIGAGQLGGRHLQGLARISLPCKIDVVDPLPISIDIARQRFAEMPPNSAIFSVNYHSSIETLPSTLDYVVIATTADVRLGVLQTLLAGRKVRSLLLEKVLFQNQCDYAVAEELLARHKVQAWVNCPRRTFPIYELVRDYFIDEPAEHFQVTGGGWGLGCNSIHFIDLLGMLTGQIPTEISTKALDNVLVPSKRKNFMEFTGCLRGRFGSTHFEFTSFSGSSARMLLMVRSDSRTCVIDETAGRAFFLDTKCKSPSWKLEDFELPHLSHFSTEIASNIMTDGESKLTNFKQSMAYHLPLLASLGAHAALTQNTPDKFCPIT
jgi:hypothetical protein